MKFEIDIENSSLSDYISEEDGEVTFTDAFKEAILSDVAYRFQWDVELRKAVKDGMMDHLYTFLAGYKDEAAIKVLTEDVIRKELGSNPLGSILRPAYKQMIEDEVKSRLAIEMKDLKQTLLTAVRNEVRGVVENLIDNIPMRQFIDTEKLAAYVQDIVEIHCMAGVTEVTPK